MQSNYRPLIIRLSDYQSITVSVGRKPILYTLFHVPVMLSLIFSKPQLKFVPDPAFETQKSGEVYKYSETYHITSYEHRLSDIDALYIPISGSPFDTDKCSRAVYPSYRARERSECTMHVVPSVSQNVTIEVQAAFLNIESLLVAKYYPQCKLDHQVLVWYQKGRRMYTDTIKLIGKMTVHVKELTSIYIQRCQFSNWYMKITEIEKHNKRVMVSPSVVPVHMLDSIIYTMPYSGKLQKHALGLDVTTEVDIIYSSSGVAPDKKDRLFILEIRLADGCNKECMRLNIFHKYNKNATSIYKWKQNSPTQSVYLLACIGINLTESLPYVNSISRPYS